jgi:hypothetical protein
MSEYLTTGQMIDKLRLGEVAVNQEGYKVKYGENGLNLLFFLPHEEPSEPNIMGDADKFIIHALWVKKDKWHITPKFVSFEEAMEAHKEEKKTVVYHHDDELKYEFKHELETGQFDKVSDDNICLYELLEGKWTIEH